MKEQVWWYATRSAGLMTWSTAVASVIVGLLLSLRAIRSRTGPWALDLHRFLGGLTLVFLIVHLMTLWADSYVEFGWRELLVPGESQLETQAVAWGVVSAWILIAVEVTSILRKHIGKMLWRVVHWSSLLAVAGGTVHGLEIGSDVDNPVVWAVAGGGSIAVIVLGAIRIRGSEVKAAGGRPRTESEILVEMRQRLPDLPVQQAQSRVEYVTEATIPLPRRETPAHEGLSAGLGMADDPVGSGTLLEALGRAVRAEKPAGGRGFAADPFESVPEAEARDTVGSWPGPSPDDPFAHRSGGDEPGTTTIDAQEAPVAPHAPSALPREVVDTGVVTEHEPTESRAPRPFLQPVVHPEIPQRMPDLSTSPFARASDLPAPHAPPLPSPPPSPASPARLGDAPLSAPVVRSPAPDTEAVDETAPRLPSRPLRPVVPFSEPAPPPMSITTPAPAPTPPPARPPTIARSAAPLGPPALPEQSIDPSTGEPDETAYKEWLVEWLAFAEQYGDEAPSDPSRA